MDGELVVPNFSSVGQNSHDTPQVRRCALISDPGTLSSYQCPESVFSSDDLHVRSPVNEAHSDKLCVLSSNTGTISSLYSSDQVTPGCTNEPLIVSSDAALPTSAVQCHFHGSDELATPRPDTLSSGHSDVFSSTSFQENDIHLNNLDTIIRPAGSISVPIRINGVCVNAIIDTAAQVSVLSTRFVDDNWSSIPYSGYVSIQGIGKSSLQSSIWENVDICLGAHTYKWHVFVAPISDSCILGLDFILNFGIDIHLSRGELVIPTMQETVSIFLEGGDNDLHFNVKTVTLDRDIFVPANSGVSVPLTVDLTDFSATDFVLFEPVEHERLGLFSVVFPADQKLPIHILNYGNTSVYLKANTIIGMIQNVDTEDFENIFESPELHFEIRNLYVDDFPECFPAVASEHFDSICETLPQHMRDLFRRSSIYISLYQAVALANLLSAYVHIFSTGDTDLGYYKGVYHYIRVRTDTGIKQRLRRTPIHFRDEEEGHLKKMLDSGIIVESESDWASPVTLVRKRDGSVRWCVDYRKLNAQTIKDCYPLPRIEDCLDTLAGTQFLSTLDMASGYWQIDIAPEDRHKTAFITRFGLFEHVRLAFGLCNAPATYQRAMQLVLRGLLWHTALVYIDDVVVLGADFESALANLRVVLERLRVNNLKLKPKKCALLQKQVRYLGRLVSPDGISIADEHVRQIRDWPIPRTRQELESFLGFMNYHREFFRGFAEMTDPLYKLASSVPNGRSVLDISDKYLGIIESLKLALIEAPILPYPDVDSTFILDCDASHVAIGCALSQVRDGKEVPIAFASYSLIPAQRKYCTTRKELLAVVRFTRLFRHYLLGRRFVVRTDHNSLRWLFSFSYVEGQLARWQEELESYDMEIVHRPGKLHTNADALSRIPDVDSFCPNYYPGVPLTSLPCFKNGQDCDFCKKADEKWSHFIDEVDYILPLSVRQISAEAPPDVSLEMLPLQTWVPSYSMDDLRQAQMDDEDLGVVIPWLEDDVQPSREQLVLTSPAVRHYWLQRRQLFLSNGVLFYHWEDTLHPRYLLVVPLALRDEVLHYCHDVRDAGHPGQHNTYTMVKRSFYWFDMQKSCRVFVRTCARCNKNKHPRRKQRGRLGEYHVSAPMDRIHVDILGPLTKSPSGNTVILMVVDQFTKWVECYPLPEQGAELLAKKLVDEFISRFGCPLEMHSDQGQNFVGKIFTHLCKLLQITKTRTTAYRPRSNGQVERYNRTLLQMIRCLREQNISAWDDYLPQITSAMRAMVNRDTGFSPNMLMLGREVYRPVDLLYDIPRVNTKNETPPEFVKRLDCKIRTSHAVARKTLKCNLQRQKKTYDLRIFERMYNSGDLVYLLNNSMDAGLSRKLKPIYKGPYVVTEVLSPSLYRIEDRRRNFVVHHDRLLLCDDRYIPFWIRRKRQEFLQLDETIPYDEDEIADIDPRDQGLFGILPTLFEEEPPAVASASASLSAANGGNDNEIVSDQVMHDGLDDLVVPQELNGASAPSDVSDNDTEVVTRAGRTIKRNPRFHDYLLDIDQIP